LFSNIKPGFNSTFTFCIICFHATEISDILPHYAAVYDLSKSALGLDALKFTLPYFSTFTTIPKYVPVAASLQTRPVVPLFVGNNKRLSTYFTVSFNLSLRSEVFKTFKSFHGKVLALKFE
jgi:hypothetical protein